MGRQKFLEDRLVTLGALSDDIEDQFSWLNRTKKIIIEAPQQEYDMYSLIHDINEIKVYYIVYRYIIQYTIYIIHPLQYTFI